jgi:hypothetical protein
MNTKGFIRLGVPLGEATRWATDFITSSFSQAETKPTWRRK